MLGRAFHVIIEGPIEFNPTAYGWNTQLWRSPVQFEKYMKLTEMGPIITTSIRMISQFACTTR